VHRGVRAQEAAGVIHSDREKHFIRAETIRWDELLDAGSEANARSKGTLRLEARTTSSRTATSCTSATADKFQ
jgi:ribosome-binding ATPase YchF (GTP1/OBG family)